MYFYTADWGVCVSAWQLGGLTACWIKMTKKATQKCMHLSSPLALKHDPSIANHVFIMKLIHLTHI